MALDVLRDLTWRHLTTLGLALAGGWIFHLLHLPLAWMLGAMCATMVAALLELPLVARTRPMRPPFAAILGVTLGATFQPWVFAQGGTLVVLLVAITVSTVLCGFAGYHYLRRVARLDPVTAYFAAMPAGLQEMALQGGQAGGDERRIALIHACRVLLLVLIVPLVYGLIYHIDSQKMPLMTRAAGDISGADWLWFGALAAVGWGAARRLAMPNAPMIGIQAGPNAFAAALRPVKGSWAAWRANGRKAYEYGFEAPAQPSPVDMVLATAHLREVLPEDAILANGAGNFTVCRTSSTSSGPRRGCWRRNPGRWATAFLRQSPPRWPSPSAPWSASPATATSR